MFWKSRAKDSAVELIKWLLDRRAQSGTGSGWPVDARTEFAMQELGNSLERPVTPFMVMKTLTKMGPLTADPLRGFESACDQVVHDARAGLGTSKLWRFILPIRIRLDDSITEPVSVRIEGETFGLARYSQLDHGQREAIDPSRLGASFHGEAVEVRSDEAFLVAEKDGPASGVAWDSIAPVFDLLRGAVEYILDRGMARLFTTRQQPRSHVPHPSVVAAVSGMEYEAHRFDITTHGPGHIVTFKPGHLALLQQVSSILAMPASESSTVSLIADALRLYAQALDAPFNHTCFVALWQLAEATTCAVDVHGASQEVAKRLTWHTERWRLAGAGLRETITELGNKRNRIVHKGIHPVSEEEINTLKYLCETTIEWLIASLTKLPTRSHVRIIYRMRTAPDAELLAQHEAAEFIRKLRQM